MKYIKLFEEFNSANQDAAEAYMQKAVKKYETWERGLIMAWGGTLYINYHNFPTAGKTQPIEALKAAMVELFNMERGSDEWLDMDEWLADGGKSDGIPLFNKKTLDNLYMEIAQKTPSPYDIIIHRSADNEYAGVNSYTLIDDDSYLGYKKTKRRGYKIPKGTPIIFAGVDADDSEIIWAPTKNQLKKFKL